MINLYIDTNAYLTFFHLTSDDLEELKKLIQLLEKGVLILHLPEQTFDEFYRNREVKIADALKRFKEDKLNNQFPQISKDYPEYEKIKSAIKEFDKNKSQLLNKLLEDIFKNNLNADKVIEELFSKSTIHKTDLELIQTSRIRFDLGRPPGKNKSYGDAINWETLLENVPNNEDLFFVSDDKDYYSEIDSSYFNNYLLNEWSQKKNSKIKNYRRISEFFKENIPDIELATDIEKETLLEELNNSGSFAKSRYTLHKLTKYEDFSTTQINSFVQACIDNSQISWIKNDEDIATIINKIIILNKSKIGKELYEDFKEEYKYE